MPDTTVATTIVEQMGGFGALRAMVGATEIVAMPDGVRFKFKGSRKANLCQVKLDASDTYTFQIYRLRGLDLTEVVKLEGVYWDMLQDLFEKYTGLTLRVPVIRGL